MAQYISLACSPLVDCVPYYWDISLARALGAVGACFDGDPAAALDINWNYRGTLGPAAGRHFATAGCRNCLVDPDGKINTAMASTAAAAAATAVMAMVVEEDPGRGTSSHATERGSGTRLNISVPVSTSVTLLLLKHYR